MAVDETGIWQQRRDTLLHQIAGLQQRITAEPDTFPRKFALKKAVTELGNFAEQHFNYFYDGFGDGYKGTTRNGAKFTHKLTDSGKYPGDYILRLIIDPIAEDMEALQRCYEQHAQYQYDNQRVGPPSKLALPVSPVKDWTQDFEAWNPINRRALALTRADKLAWAALEPAKKLGLIPDETTAIVYFRKVPAVRIIPYATVALVGVPWTVVDVPRDYLAIPHEVGHYVYWNAIGATGIKGKEPLTLAHELAKLFLSAESWIKNWLEETFADVYGGLVAGAFIAQSFQDLGFDATDDQFLEDDAEHPAAAIRPEIYDRVLRYAAPPPADDVQRPAADHPDWMINPSQLADLLRAQWLKRINSRSNVLPMINPLEQALANQTQAAPAEPDDDLAFLIVKDIDGGKKPLPFNRVRRGIRWVIRRMLLERDHPDSKIKEKLPPPLALDELLPLESFFPRPVEDTVIQRMNDERLDLSAALYAEFERLLPAIDGQVTFTRAQDEAATPITWATWRERYDAMRHTEVTVDGETEEIPTKYWLEFYKLSGGWTTEGDGSRPTGVGGTP